MDLHVLLVTFHLSFLTRGFVNRLRGRPHYKAALHTRGPPPPPPPPRRPGPKCADASGKLVSDVYVRPGEF